MSGEGSTPGGARASISRVGEACRIQIGRNDVFLECFHERKGSITTQQKFEEKGLIVSTLVVLHRDSCQGGHAATGRVLVTRTTCG